MSGARRVAVVTTSRADYGPLRSVIRAIHEDPALELQLLVSGSHLDPARGETVRDVERDGWPIRWRLPIHAEGDDEVAAAATLARAIAAAAPALARARPDVLLVLGDRSEALGFGLAARLLRIPLAHVHGGEVTGGALDESFRHALTKLASYHFVAAAAHAAVVRQLGEDPAAIFTVGAPGLDDLDAVADVPRGELLARLGLAADAPTALLAFHPVTTEGRDRAVAQIDALLAAVAGAGLQAVMTGAGADAHGAAVDARLAAAAAARPGRLVFRPHLGRELFVNGLRHLDVMVGNSSAGLIEAPSCGLPVVNVGDRQQGRLQAANVLQADVEPAALAAALRTALGASFRARARRAVNPYRAPGGRPAGEAIRDALKTVELGPAALKKRLRTWDGRDA